MISPGWWQQDEERPLPFPAAGFIGLAGCPLRENTFLLQQENFYGFPAENLSE